MLEATRIIFNINRKYKLKVSIITDGLRMSWQNIKYNTRDIDRFIRLAEQDE